MTSMTLRIAVSLAPDGGWEVSGGEEGALRVSGTVPPEAVTRLLAEASARPTLVHTGRAWGRAEQQIGRGLARIFDAVPDLAYVLHQALPTRPTVVIEAERAELRALPWECLAARSAASELPMEPSGRALVARLGPSARRLDGPPGPGSSLKVRIWCPDPRDPDCGARLATLLGDPRLDATTDLAGAPDGAAEVLHLVCHGRGDAQGVELALRGETSGSLEAGPDVLGVQAPVHGLGPLVRRARLVVLEVCSAGHPTERALDSLVGRLLDAGAHACTAPAQAIAAEASATFVDGLYAALLAGETLVEAVGAGRRALAARDEGHPSRRWWNPALHVARTGLLGEPILVRPWTLPGWPRGGARVGAALASLRSAPAVATAGFIGVEHLVEALLTAPGGGPLGAQAAYALGTPAGRALRSSLTEALAVLVSASPPRNDSAPSPWMLDLGGRLLDGFDAEDLWVALAAHPLLRPLLGPLGAALADGTLPSELGCGGLVEPVAPPSVPITPPTQLLVVGGPEDGRVFVPAPRDIVGRWDPDKPSNIQLYRDTSVVDRRLSSAHLRWDRPGAASALKTVWLTRNHGRHEVRNEAGSVMALGHGDMLRLGHTRLVAVVPA